ncbi:MAG TPA: hypothetical protein VF693_01135 [Allosphingosinicella sp.]
MVADRPFEPALAYAAARLHFDATHDWAAYVARVRALAAVDPNMITSLYALAIMRGEYADAVGLHPQIVMSMPRARGGYEIVGIHDLAAEQVTMRAWLDGSHAYALEAQGDAAAADAALAAARADLEAALAPPVRPDGRRPGRQQRQRHAAIDRRREEATTGLAVWERHIRLRRLANDGRIDEVLAEMRRERIPSDTAAIALLEQIGHARPAMGDEVRSVVSSLRERIYASIAQIMAFGPRELLEHLPEPESRQRLPDYDPTGGAFRIAAQDGYRTRRGPLAGVRTVRFSSPRGSIAIANELALLRSAQLARETGRRGLIVIARRGVVRTLSTTGFGGVPLQRPTGQEVEIDVLLVDPANLPPDYVDARWRVLDPDAIWAALSPIYPAPALAAAR